MKTKAVFTMSLPASETQYQLPTFAGDAIGEKVIEGLNCRGYRIKQQENGEVEYWVSEELLEVILARTKLRDEETTLPLFNIKRVEPNSRLFTVPRNYTQQQ